MARADSLFELIKYGLINDFVSFRKAVEALCVEERAKQHTVLANKIQELLLDRDRKVESKENVSNMAFLRNGTTDGHNLFWEKIPQKKFDHLILTNEVKQACNDLINEQLRADLLRSYGLEPRNRILLIGPPGNGKTSLAEAIAESLSVPLLTVRYESIIGSYLGETATRLSKLIEYAKTRSCVLFFDEFETLGKERGDIHETGEIKRVVSSLLMYIDSLPSYVVVIAATNHENLLDKAAWRRFQLKLEIPKPNLDKLEEYFRFFEKERNFNFEIQVGSLAKKTVGLSYSEAEELALTIYRQYVLQIPVAKAKKVTEQIIKLWQTQRKNSMDAENGVDSSCQKKDR